MPIQPFRNLRSALAILSCAVLLAACAAERVRKPGAGGSATEDATDANSHLVIAEIALQRGDYNSAAMEYNAAAMHSSNPRLAEQATKVAFENGQDTAAAASARRWLDLDSANVDAHRYLAIVALRLHLLPEATSQFEYLLQHGYSDAATGFVDLTAILAEEENSYGALRVVNALAARHQDLAEAHYAVGAAALRSWDYRLAVERLRRATMLKPELVDAKRLLARALVVNGQTAEGLALARAEAQAGNDPQARLEVVLLLIAAADETAARAELKPLLDWPDARIEALRTLATMDLSAGKLDDAARNFTELLTTGRYVSLAFYSLGIIHERRHEGLRAIRYLTRITSGPFASDAQLRAARLLAAADQRDQAIQLLDTYVAEHPDAFVPVAVGRARLISEEGDSEAALDLLDEALQKFPDSQPLHYSRAVTLERMERIGDAIAEQRAILARRPEDPVAMNALGYLLAEHKRDLREAQNLIKRAIEMTPDNAAVQDSMGWVLFRQGDNAAARKWLERAYAAEKDAEIAAHLGEVIWAQGDHKQARAIWERALADDPDHRYLLKTLRQHPD